MWNEPSTKELNQIPKLYETEDVPAKDKMIYMHFFLASSDWYVAEFDGDDTFFGFVCLTDGRIVQSGATFRLMS